MWPTQQTYSHASDERFHVHAFRHLQHMTSLQHVGVAGNYQGAETWWSPNPQQYFPIDYNLDYGSVKAASQPMPYMHTPRLHLWPNTSHHLENHAAQASTQTLQRLPMSGLPSGSGELSR